MYNTKFSLLNNEDIYPGYLSKESRKQIRDQYGMKREYMWCGCRSNHKLFYRISEDLKIYPEHKGYIHAPDCSRYIDNTGNSNRKTGYVVNEESGEVTAYLTFNPRNCSEDRASDEKIQTLPEDSILLEELNLEEMVIGKEGDTKKSGNKDVKLSFEALVRSINIDTFTERSVNGLMINTKEKFSKQVYYRMKKVRPNRMKKSIGDLSIEKDGVRFIYTPYSSYINKTDNGLTKSYLVTKGSDGKDYNNFLYPKTLEKALHDYEKKYHIQPDSDTMVAAFQYVKKNRSGNTYRVLGRVHLFLASEIGLYCRNVIERNTYNALSNLALQDDDVQFWIPAEDDSIGAIMKVKGKKKKLLIIFKTNKSEHITYDNSEYLPLVLDKNSYIDEGSLYLLIEAL